MGIGNPIRLTGNVASKDITVTATEGQTQFTVTGGYDINQLAVFRNGIRLVDGQDFTARDGSLVTLLSPATAGDAVAFRIFADFKVADAIQGAKTNQTINGNLVVTGSLDVQTGDTKTAFIGVSSAGTNIGVAKTLNFIGAGNTFAVTGDTIEVSIAGGGGGGIGTAVKDANDNDTPFTYIDRFTSVTSDLVLDTTTAGLSTSYVVSVVPNITITNGIGVTVGTGKTLVIDVLKIGDL
jgi:hypothetical protein